MAYVMQIPVLTICHSLMHLQFAEQPDCPTGRAPKYQSVYLDLHEHFCQLILVQVVFGTLQGPQNL